MLLPMALQKDREFMFYIQILYPPQKILYPPQMSELTEISQLLLDVSQPLDIVTDSVYCAQTISLLETARLKPKPNTYLIS